MNISESGMTFGEYKQDDVFHIEKTSLYKSLGEGVKSVEFVLRRGNNRLLFLEAKSSTPMPDNREKFDVFIAGIVQKIRDSVDLYLALLMKRFPEWIDELSEDFRIMNFSEVNLTAVLVVRDYKKEWLLPVSEKLRIELKSMIKIWRLNVKVLNEDMALKMGLVEEESPLKTSAQ